MKKDIILSGVGGQGILTIATVIGEAATKAGLYLKQAEVHGMSQRGGDVQSNLRLSSQTIFSDLIPQGTADMIISMEPMEALRYVPYLNKDGWIITSDKPLINIPAYPEPKQLTDALNAMPHVLTLDIETKAKELAAPKSANMILLGMAAKYLEIISPNELRKAIDHVFASKGEDIVLKNRVAFDEGLKTEPQKN